MKFELNGSDSIELKNLLKVCGLCENGAAAKEAISEGLVKVDGQVEIRKACKILSGQTVNFGKTQIQVVD